MKLISASDLNYVGRLQVGSALAISVMLFANWWLMGNWHPIAADYAVFWKAVRQQDYYGGTLHFAYPPPALIVLKPLTLFPFWSGYIAWICASALLFYLATKRLCGRRIAGLSLLGGAALAGYLMGQIPMLLSAAILLAFSIPLFWGGVLLGAVAVVKPQLLVMAPLVMVVRRDWAMLSGALLGGLAMIVTAIMLFGANQWIEWLRALPAFHRAVIETRVPPMTLAAIAEWYGLDPLPWLIAGIVLAIATIVFMARKLEGPYLAALMVGPGLLAVPYALPHDSVAVAPACVAYILNRPGYKAFPAMGYLAAWGIAPISALIALCVSLKALIRSSSGPAAARLDPNR